LIGWGFASAHARPAAVILIDKLDARPFEGAPGDGEAP
jgi:hypothetical protein